MTVCTSTVSGKKYRECVVTNCVVWLYKQAPVQWRIQRGVHGVHGPPLWSNLLVLIISQASYQLTENYIQLMTVTSFLLASSE